MLCPWPGPSRDLDDTSDSYVDGAQDDLTAVNFFLRGCACSVESGGNRATESQKNSGQKCLLSETPFSK